MSGEQRLPLRREARILVASLCIFLIALIVTLVALTSSLLELDRRTAKAKAAAASLGSHVAGNGAMLEERLDLLRRELGITRIEVFQGPVLVAAAGASPTAAELVTEPVPGGRIVFQFDAAQWTSRRRSTLVLAGLATVAAISGLLLLLVYVGNFVRRIGQLLHHAETLGGDRGRVDDARYLVDSFGEAVRRIQRQGDELQSIHDAATARQPDFAELARVMASSFTSGFLAVDADEMVVAANAASRSILKLDAGDLPIPFALDVIPEPLSGVLAAALRQRAALSRQELELPAHDVRLGLSTVPLQEGPRLLGMFALFTDLTALHAAESRVRDLENLVALGQITAGIAHEFRNSLFTITGHLQLAHRSPSAAGDNLLAAQAEAMSLSGAIDALLSFARPLTVRLEPLLLDALVEEIVDRAKAGLPAISITCTGSRNVAMRGDADLLRVAVGNVLRNAVESVQQRPGNGGRIDVRVDHEPRPAVIIADDGVGLDPARAEELTLPFQSTKPNGFGLGLALARKIVVHHGGVLTLQGAPGAGATVRIEFFPREHDTKSTTIASGARPPLGAR